MYVAHERRAYILKLLEQQGHLRSADLARDLGVTDETIRTDLVALQRKGLLKRVHGGAQYVLPINRGGQTTEQGPDDRMADRLAEHIRAGMSLYLDDAVFSLVLAWRLRENPCNITAASPRLLARLAAETLGHRLFCPGGEWDKATGLITPLPTSFRIWEEHPPELAVLRPDAVRPGQIGYHTPARAAWAAAALVRATRCFVAVPAEALLAEAPHTLACTPTLLVTENNLPVDMQNLPGLQTVPYISRESLLPTERFDY